jgi:hypothetical protein
MARKYFELSKEEEQRALDVHEKALVINALSLFRGKGGSTEVANFQKYCDTMKEGGVSAVNLTIASGQDLGNACLVIS